MASTTIESEETVKQDVVLVTGANGEIGHGLIQHLHKNTDAFVVAFDITPLDDELLPQCNAFIQGDILDSRLLGEIEVKYAPNTIFHLASILSTQAEHVPETAHRVNVDGTLNILKSAVQVAKRTRCSVKVIYPSSIAVYGIPDLKTKQVMSKASEGQFCQPITMYGCNKLSCENLGNYYAHHYRQLANEVCHGPIDFRALRFPGLISAMTVPTGGTSDYGPEMLHHAARGVPYTCFVRPGTTLPFMVMADAVKALLELTHAPVGQLTQGVYNVTSFAPTAQEIRDLVCDEFPNAAIEFEPDGSRQAIVDSWPADIDDTAARADWGWQPDYDLERAFAEYLIPAIRSRYQREPER